MGIKVCKAESTYNKYLIDGKAKWTEVSVVAGGSTGEAIRVIPMFCNSPHVAKRNRTAHALNLCQVVDFDYVVELHKM